MRADEASYSSQFFGHIWFWFWKKKNILLAEVFTRYITQAQCRELLQSKNLFFYNSLVSIDVNNFVYVRLYDSQN